jgi:hypothetical protein
VPQILRCCDKVSLGRNVRVSILLNPISTQEFATRNCTALYCVPHSVDDQLPSLDLRLALQEPRPTIDRGKEVCDVVQDLFGGARL